MQTASQAQAPQVGVGVIVVRDGLVLLGKRKGAHGAGTWAFPGGHLEFGESIEACARREVMEETGLELRSVRPGPYTNDFMPQEGKHYVTCYIQAVPSAGEAQVLEPTKCERWTWFKWSELPQELFAPVRHLLAQGYIPNAA